MNSRYPTAFVWQLESPELVEMPLELKFALDFYWEAGNQSGFYSASFKLEAFKVRWVLQGTTDVSFD